MSYPNALQRETRQEARALYIPVRAKFWLVTLCSVIYSIAAAYMAQRWVDDLSQISGTVIAYLVIYGIAVIPAFMNCFLVTSLLWDRRPGFVEKIINDRLPPITILVAAYNESGSILSTLESIDRQSYPGDMRVIVINDGSKDDTLEKLSSVSYPWLQVMDMGRNVGKANALTAALERVQTALTITVDADCFLYKNALTNLVRRYLSDPANTGAVAGAVLVRNSRVNLVTKAQEWDYFHGIAAVKRMQSLYQGTLVAQGAFSLYETSLLRRVGGWPHTVGEDIVLTWALLKQGYRVGYAENACVFTNVPETVKQFIGQRLRWSRGLIEAFKLHWQMLFKPRMVTMFVWWNLLFPYLDLVFTLAFLPGIVLALFGVYWIAGPMTLLVLPLACLVNAVMFSIQKNMFDEQSLRVRRNRLGFVLYALFYSMVLQPACVWGYVKEVVSRTKNWGTK